MANIVVGRANGVVCSATQLPEKALVVISDYPKAVQEKLQAQAGAHMIGDASARMIYSTAPFEAEVPRTFVLRSGNCL